MFAPNLQSVENTVENTMLGTITDSNNAAYGGVASTHEVKAELQVVNMFAIIDSDYTALKPTQR